MATWYYKLRLMATDAVEMPQYIAVCTVVYKT